MLTIIGIVVYSAIATFLTVVPIPITYIAMHFTKDKSNLLVLLVSLLGILMFYYGYTELLPYEIIIKNKP